MKEHATKILSMLNYINTMQFNHENSINEISNKIEDYILEHREELGIPDYYRVVVKDGVLKCYNSVTKSYDHKMVFHLLSYGRPIMPDIIDYSPWS